MPTGTTNPVIPGCGFHHISIQTTDFDAALAFYRDVLGMALRAAFDVGGRPFALLDMGDGAYVELQAPKPGAPAEAAPALPLAHFALAVTDARAAVERVRAAGFPITVEPKEVDLAGQMPATVAFFTGPSGESVELFQEH